MDDYSNDNRNGRHSGGSWNEINIKKINPAGQKDIREKRPAGGRPSVSPETRSRTEQKPERESRPIREQQKEKEDTSKPSSGGRRSGGGNFLAQGSILAVSGIIVRIIGLLYRVPVVNIIGEQGSGYYSIAFEVYNVALILSSYSLPLAVSKLMAAREIQKKYKDSYRIFLCALGFAIVSGLVMGLAVYFGSGFIAETMFHMPGIIVPLKVLAPTILICAVLGVLRGFYQGKRTMIPTAISQILEQIVNAAVSIGAAALLMKRYEADPLVYSYGAAGSTLGTAAGALIALLFLVLVFILYRPTIRRQIRRQERREGVLDQESYGAVLKLLIWTIIPVILSQTIYQISGLLDSYLFSNIMAGKGMSVEERSALTGIYGSKYRTLINVPIAISQAIATSMVPSIVTSCIQGKDRETRYKISSAVKFNMIIAIPAAVGLGVLSRPILTLLFSGSTETAFRILSAGAVAVVFYALSTVTNGVLQGLNKMHLPVVHSAVSLAVHLILVYALLKFTGLGIYALVIGNVTFPLVVSVLNWISIGRELDYRQEIKTTFLIPAVSSVLMGAAALGVYKLLYLVCKSNAVSCCAAIAAAVLVYGLSLVVMRCFTKDELYDFPMGGRLVRLLMRFHLMN